LPPGARQADHQQVMRADDGARLTLSWLPDVEQVGLALHHGLRPRQHLHALK